MDNGTLASGSAVCMIPQPTCYSDAQSSPPPLLVNFYCRGHRPWLLEGNRHEWQCEFHLWVAVKQLNEEGA